MKPAARSPKFSPKTSVLKRWRSRRAHWQSQSPLLLLLLFLLSATVPLVSVQVAASPSITVQAQSTDWVTEGKTLYGQGRFAEAAIAWQRAAEAYGTSGDRLNQAMALSNLSLTYQQLGRWQEAETAIASGIDLVQAVEPTPEQQRILAQSLDILGNLQRETGRSAEAVDTWQRAETLYATLENSTAVTRSRLAQGRALQDLGLYPRACQTLLAALDLPNETCQVSPENLDRLAQQPATPLQLAGIEALGNILRVSGRSQNAQQVLTAGLALAESSGDPQIQATFHLGLGNTTRSLLLQSPVFNRRQQQLQEEEILNQYERAATLATARETQLQARLDRLSFLVSRDRLEEAQTEVRSLVSEVATLPPDRMGIYAQLHLAQSWLDLNQQVRDNTLPPELDSLLGTAIARSQALGDSRTQAHAYGLRGRLYEQATSISDNFQQAAALTQEALRLAPAYEAPDIAYLMFWQLGRIQSAKGQREEAIARYDQAVEILESLRADLVASGSEAQFSFRESIEPVYRELAGLLLQPVKSGEEIPPETLQETLRRVRQLIESLQLAELDNFFQDACLDAQPTEIEALDPNAAILYTAILPDRTTGTESLEVITAIPGQPLYHHTTQLQTDEIGDTVLLLRSSITNIRRPFSPEPAEKLYDWLIRPIRDRLQASGVQTLVFILDSELRSLPVAALYDGEQYLVQNYTLALTPGLQLLDPQPLAREQLTILSAGLTEARQGFAPLPFVGLELESIQQKAPAEVLLNDAFTKDNFKTTFADLDAPIIHIATHGEFSSNAEDTFILTWDDRINAKDLGSLLQGEPGDRQAIELLVLSACRTAVGDRRAALGLAGVAVRAGARSTMASLWYVDDEATARLMTRFYQELTTTNATKSEALRAAQVATLTQEEFARPLYWAAFVLVGNWL